MQTLIHILGADDLRWISGYVSIKEARSPALWWHQDWWCWDHDVTFRRPASQVAVLCYLTDTSAHNGGLRILPGSHWRSAPIHATLPEAHSRGAEGLEPGHVAMSDLEGQVTVSVEAGDSVVIDYRLLHATHHNISDARRDCVLLSFAPSWRGLPEEIRAHLISHPAQPTEGETSSIPPAISKFLPSFEGQRRTLALNRNAPSKFDIGD